MGLLDKVKSALGSNKDKAKQGVDVAADQAEKAVPDQYDDKVEQASEAAKDGIDKID